MTDARWAEIKSNLTYRFVSTMSDMVESGEATLQEMEEFLRSQETTLDTEEKVVHLNEEAETLIFMLKDEF
jgi:hypothetical protein